MKTVTDETLDLELTDEYFDTLALKSAVWAYLVDHAQAVPGSLRVFIEVKGEKDFWRRVSARKHGDYRVKENAKLLAKATAKQKRLQELEIGQSIANKRQMKFARLRKGTLTQKARYYVVLLLRVIANKLVSLR